jgi:hypothetical protein
MLYIVFVQESEVTLHSLQTEMCLKLLPSKGDILHNSLSLISQYKPLQRILQNGLR